MRAEPAGAPGGVSSGGGLAGDVYDYVIVGAGSAGCVLANRLSADPAASVLLLEAGGSDRALRVRTPGLVSLLSRSRFDWTFHTHPQDTLEGREMHWPRGKGLGGSSSINYMIYMRGHRADYDGWAAAGCEGWSYEEVLPHFRRSENNVRGADRFHGTGGELDVTDLRPNPMIERLVEATATALGVPVNPDFNGAEQEGAGLHQVTIRNGRRASSATAFLHPVRARPNLTVVTGALATGIRVERGRAVGVRYRAGGRERSAEAAREVVLAAGAVGSPHLLLLSGIGPAGELEARGIPVVHDLSGVGKNLQDHLFVPIAWEDRAKVTGNVQPLNLLLWLARHALTRGGPMASNAAEAGAFVRSSPSLPRPDLQLHFLPVGSEQASYDRTRFIPKGNVFAVLPTLLFPESRGEIRLRSADPAEPPVIDPRYLSEEADLEVLAEGVRMARRIAATEPVAECRGRALTPLCDTEDEAELRAGIRRSCTTLFHPVGSCRMGSDPDSVVDPSLRVRGIEGLRVVDASIMPTIIGGNTNAPVMMIAEKGAEMMRGGG